VRAYNIIITYSTLRVYFLSKPHIHHTLIYNTRVYIVYPHTHIYIYTRWSSVCVCSETHNYNEVSVLDDGRSSSRIHSRIFAVCRSARRVKVRIYATVFVCARERRWQRRRPIRSTFDTSYKPERTRHYNDKMRIVAPGDLNAADAQDVILYYITYTAWRKITIVMGVRFRSECRLMLMNLVHTRTSHTPRPVLSRYPTVVVAVAVVINILIIKICYLCNAVHPLKFIFIINYTYITRICERTARIRTW